MKKMRWEVKKRKERKLLMTRRRKKAVRRDIHLRRRIVWRTGTVAFVAGTKEEQARAHLALFDGRQRSTARLPVPQKIVPPLHPFIALLSTPLQEMEVGREVEREGNSVIEPGRKVLAIGH